MYQDPVREFQFREHFFLSVVDRYNLLLGWIQIVGWMFIAVAAIVLILFDEGDMGQYYIFMARPKTQNPNSIFQDQLPEFEIPSKP
jgi:hypothetical protein